MINCPISTGIVDPAFLQMIRTPRCGVKDVDRHSAHGVREKRWVAYYDKDSSFYRKRVLTYKITKYSRHLTMGEVDETAAQAFQVSIISSSSFALSILLSCLFVFWELGDFVVVVVVVVVVYFVFTLRCFIWKCLSGFRNTFSVHSKPISSIYSAFFLSICN